MPKNHDAHRDLKKKPLLTLKEKRTAKHAKKQNRNSQSMVMPATTH